MKTPNKEDRHKTRSKNTKMKKDKMSIQEEDMYAAQNIDFKLTRIKLLII